MKRERVFISNTLLVRRVIDTLSLHGHNHLIHDVLDLIKSKVWVLEGEGNTHTTILRLTLVNFHAFYYSPPPLLPNRFLTS